MPQEQRFTAADAYVALLSPIYLAYLQKTQAYFPVEPRVFAHNQPHGALSVYVDGQYAITLPFGKHFDCGQYAAAEIEQNISVMRTEFLKWVAYFDFCLKKVAAAPRILHGDSRRLSTIVGQHGPTRSQICRRALGALYRVPTGWQQAARHNRMANAGVAAAGNRRKVSKCNAQFPIR